MGESIAITSNINDYIEEVNKIIDELLLAKDYMLDIMQCYNGKVIYDGGAIDNQEKFIINLYAQINKLTSLYEVGALYMKTAGNEFERLNNHTKSLADHIGTLAPKRLGK